VSAVPRTSSSRADVHATAVVDPRAELEAGVSVGPFCVVGPGVRLGEGTQLLGHAVVGGRTVLGKRNVVHPFAVIGGDPQIRKEAAAPGDEPLGAGALVIGDENVFREGVTVNVASGDAPTRIGSRNLFMAGAHVAHDVVVGSSCVVANAVQLAGHVVVEDWVTFGGLSGVAQWLRIGESAFVAAGAMCERDVPPFVIAQGDRARVRALNVVGLERRGVPAESIARLRQAFARVFVAREPGFEAAARQLDRSDPYVEKLARALLGT